MIPTVKVLRAWLADNPTGTMRDIYQAFRDTDFRRLGKSLAYLAGICTLFDLDPAGLAALHREGRLNDKTRYEKLVAPP